LRKYEKDVKSLNRGEKNYIKVIFQIAEQDSYESKSFQYITNNLLSEHLGNTSQTVIEMIKKLDQKGID
jgi:Mn-dependent DtxR family transcriptional regulator